MFHFFLPTLTFYHDQTFISHIFHHHYVSCRTKFFNYRNTLADDIKTPLFFPELKVMDFQRATRLLKERSYARKDPFLSDNLNTKPTIQDLASPPSNNLDKLWVSSWFRLVVGLTSWTVFPFMTMYVYDLAKNSVGGQEFIAAEVAFNLSSFLPSVSLIYGKMKVCRFVILFCII